MSTAASDPDATRVAGDGVQATSPSHRPASREGVALTAPCSGLSRWSSAPSSPAAARRNQEAMAAPGSREVTVGPSAKAMTGPSASTSMPPVTTRPPSTAEARAWEAPSLASTGMPTPAWSPSGSGRHTAPASSITPTSSTSPMPRPPADSGARTEAAPRSTSASHLAWWRLVAGSSECSRAARTSLGVQRPSSTS